MHLCQDQRRIEKVFQYVPHRHDVKALVWKTTQCTFCSAHANRDAEMFTCISGRFLIELYSIHFPTERAQVSQVVTA